MMKTKAFQASRNTVRVYTGMGLNVVVICQIKRTTNFLKCNELSRKFIGRVNEAVHCLSGD